MEECIVACLLSPVKIYDEKLLLNAIDEKIDLNKMTNHMSILLAKLRDPIPVEILEKLMLAGVKIPINHKFSVYDNIIANPQLLEFSIKYLPISDIIWLVYTSTRLTDEQWGKLIYYHDVNSIPPYFLETLVRNVADNQRAVERLINATKGNKKLWPEYEKVFRGLTPHIYKKFIAEVDPVIKSLNEKLDDLRKYIIDNKIDVSRVAGLY
jgi:hypothetical protein